MPAIRNWFGRWPKRDLTNEERRSRSRKIVDDSGLQNGAETAPDRVERSFSRIHLPVPAGLLADAGLKRHYKLPEAIKILRKSPTDI